MNSEIQKYLVSVRFYRSIDADDYGSWPLLNHLISLNALFNWGLVITWTYLSVMWLNDYILWFRSSDSNLEPEKE